MATLRVALFWSAVIACVIAQLAIVRSTLLALRTPTTSDGLAADASLASATDARRQPLPMPRRPLELLWLALPTVALAWLFAAGWQLLPARP